MPPMIIRVGQMLYGFCGGYFGDSYNDKRVEAVGVDWVVAREDNGQIVFANTEPKELLGYCDKEEDY